MNPPNTHPGGVQAPVPPQQINPQVQSNHYEGLKLIDMPAIPSNTNSLPTSCGLCGNATSNRSTSAPCLSGRLWEWQPGLL